MGKVITDVVREKYAAVATSDLSSAHTGVHAVAEAFGYTAEELASIPAEANMGLSCGNPTATAHLRPGEVVVDLGSGGGLDVFLAAKQVGPTGKAIGIDMTPEMIERARAGAAKMGLANVEFHLSTIDKLPLPDASVDCVISNCVINLAPDKPAVLREIFRVLKPGGRVAVSDIALKKPLPAEVGQDLMAYVGCIAGAVLIDEYVTALKSAGFAAVQVVDTKKDLMAYAKVENQGGCCGAATPAGGTTPAASSCCTPVPSGAAECCDQPADGSACCAPAPAGSTACCSPKSATPPDSTVHGGLAELLAKYDVNEYAASVQVYAVKAGADVVRPEPAKATTLQVFDKPMCCSTGVCGPAVDPVLPAFAADLAWLAEQGVTVERYNLAQQPHAFVDHADVTLALREGVEEALPLVRVDGEIVSKGAYPSRDQLAKWCGLKRARSLAVTKTGGDCCGPTGCC